MRDARVASGEWGVGRWVLAVAAKPPRQPGELSIRIDVHKRVGVVVDGGDGFRERSKADNRSLAK